MIKSTIPESESGNWKIQKFTVNKEEAAMHNLLCAIKGRFSSLIDPGDYTKLSRGTTLVMSDTPSELQDHKLFIKNAKGAILIAGLGLGLVTIEVMKKRNVTSVVVVEKSKDVIDLVQSYLPKEFEFKIELVHADIFDYEPKHAFDYAWFDIWDNICEDNIDDFNILKERYFDRVLNMGYWSLQQLMKETHHDFYDFINEDFVNTSSV